MCASFVSAGRFTGQQLSKKLSILDLRRSGISILDRLVLEEALLRHDPLQRCWAIVGTHEPTHNRLVHVNNEKIQNQISQNPNANKNCAIVLGIGGKPQDLLNLDLIQRDSILCIKRFSGGGTVVVDHSSLFTTFIGRSGEGQLLTNVDPYPRDIMQWTADMIFEHVFDEMNRDLLDVGSSKKKNRPSLVVDSKSCGMENSGEIVSFPRDENLKSLNEMPKFALRENDYVFDERKMGGSAQSIVKGGWLHHTSFLWDYESNHMEYLTLPSKRPDYRGDRSHEDFLVKLKTYYNSLKHGKHVFFDTVKDISANVFDVEEVTLQEALALIDSELGGMQKWFDGKCRTRIIDFDSLK